MVRVTIGSFSVAALLGVLALLSGDFGETQWRILATTLLVGVSSVLVLSYLATHGTRAWALGAAGAVADLTLVVATLVLIWVESAFDTDAVAETAGVTLILALTLAQLSLLVLRAASRPGLRPLVLSTGLLAAVLAVLLSAAVLGRRPGRRRWSAGRRGGDPRRARHGHHDRPGRVRTGSRPCWSSATRALVVGSRDGAPHPRHSALLRREAAATGRPVEALVEALVEDAVVGRLGVRRG